MRSRWKATASSRRAADVELLEQLDLLLEAQVGGVAGGVGERAGLGDRAQEGADPVVGVAQLEDLLDHGAVLALERAQLVVALGRVVVGGDLDPQRAVQVGASRSGDAAAQALEGDGAGAAGKLEAVVDGGDRADGGELLAGARDEQDLVLGARVDRERQVHAGEDDDVVEGDQGKRAHAFQSSLPWLRTAGYH